MSSSFIYLADFPEKHSLINSSGAITYSRRPLWYFAEFTYSTLGGLANVVVIGVRTSGWRKSLVSKDPNELQSDNINQTTTIYIIILLVVATTALPVALHSKPEEKAGWWSCLWQQLLRVQNFALGGKITRCNACFVKHYVI